jgi:flagellar motor switch/type III secretory pathway protein FliN
LRPGRSILAQHVGIYGEIPANSCEEATRKGIEAMADLTASVASEVVEACRGGAGEAAEALQRALDLADASIEVGEPGQVAMGSLPEGFDGAGLVVVLTTGGVAAILALPESSELVPEWTAAPDPTGQSKLTTLAQELGMILLPEQFMPEDFQASRVKSLKGGLARGGIIDGAGLVPLEITSGDKKGSALLVFPAPKPAGVIGAASGEAPSRPAKPAPKPEPAAIPAAKPSAGFSQPTKPRPCRSVTVDALPAYSRSLLRIKVPVVVTLAEKRQSLDQIMELGPGSIIQFDKSCEEMLELDVGGRAVASGEAVKVGDKFGLRINAITLPDERFERVNGPEQSVGHCPQ